MQHAYCIIAHSYPQQLWHLIGLLDDDRNDIYIHIDQKVDIQLFTPPPPIAIIGATLSLLIKG